MCQYFQGHTHTLGSAMGSYQDATISESTHLLTKPALRPLKQNENGAINDVTAGTDVENGHGKMNGNDKEKEKEKMNGNGNGKANGKANGSKKKKTSNGTNGNGNGNGHGHANGNGCTYPGMSDHENETERYPCSNGEIR